MMSLGWSLPAEKVDPKTAREGILRQHQHLRGLLARAGATAEAALDGSTASGDAVASAIGDIRASVEVHLAFEERLLVPLLQQDLPHGPDRALELVEDHKRQRALLSRLHQEAGAHPELPILAAKLAFLTQWLLGDMVEEERTLLSG